MTVQDVIKQTQKFNLEQKKELAFHFLLPTLKGDKKDYILKLLQKYINLGTSKEESANSLLGIFPKDTFKMSDDFDEPLEDFKDYM